MDSQSNETLGPQQESPETQLVASERARTTVFEKLVDWFVESDPWHVRRYVGDLRERFPDASNDELARKVVGLKSLKNGFVGAATATPGFLAFPIAIPADLIMSWKIQINMAMCVAHIYGHTIDGEDAKRSFKTDIYLILAGNAARDCLSVFGVNVDAVTKKSIKLYLTREVTIEVWKLLARKIITTAGVRAFSRVSRAIPLIGAPIGFAFDYSATRSVGDVAVNYYGPDSAEAVEVAAAMS